MEKELLQALPTWYKNINPADNYLVLSDDLDSYYSCCLLHTLTECEVEGFYDFKKGLFVSEDVAEEIEWDKPREPIYVDADMIHLKCFGNHYLPPHKRNPQAINPNIITGDTYTDKYNGSTLALIVSLYDIQHTLSEKKRTDLITTDAWYSAYYDEHWQESAIKWMKLLDLYDVLLPLLQKHDYSYFCGNHKREKIKITQDWDNDDIYYLNGVQSLTRFKLVQKVKNKCGANIDYNNLFSAAKTSSSRYCYSVIRS